MGPLCLILAAAPLAALPMPGNEPQIGVLGAAPSQDEVGAGRAHVHEIVIDLERTPARRVRVLVELSGARRPSRLMRRFAAGALSIGAGFVRGRAAGLIPTLVNSMTPEMAGSGDSVFSVRGRTLRPLGGGLHVLSFQCVHDPAHGGGGAAVRVTVIPLGEEGEATAGPWRPLLSSSSALSSGQLP